MRPFSRVSISNSKADRQCHNLLDWTCRYERLEVWRPSKLAAWLELGSVWWTKSWHFVKRKRKKAMKNRVFKVRFFSSTAQPEVQSRLPQKSRFPSVEATYKATKSFQHEAVWRAILYASLYLLCVVETRFPLYQSIHTSHWLQDAARRPYAFSHW